VNRDDRRWHLSFGAKVTRTGFRNRRDPMLTLQSYSQGIDEVMDRITDIEAADAALAAPGSAQSMVATWRRVADALLLVNLQYSAGVHPDRLCAAMPHVMRWATDHLACHHAYHRTWRWHRRPSVQPWGVESLRALCVRLLSLGLLTDCWSHIDSLWSRAGDAEAIDKHHPANTLIDCLARAPVEREEPGARTIGWSWEVAALTYLLGVDVPLCGPRSAYPCDMVAHARRVCPRPRVLASCTMPAVAATGLA